MFNYLVSIIVPIYNRCETLRVCVDSILSQEYENIEVILVDDGSVDGSSLICDEYEKQDKRVKVLHQKNLGVSKARNNGLVMAKGSWVTFVDSDDAVLPKHISQLALSQGLFDLVMVNRAMGIIDNDEIVVKSDFCTGLENKQLYGRKSIIGYLFGGHNPYAHAYYAIWDKFFKKQILTENRIFFNERMSFGEDQLFVLEYLQHVKSFMFSNVGTYVSTPLSNLVVIGEHLGYKLRSPEEYLYCFLNNYQKMSDVAKETNLNSVKGYAVNYIVNRPLHNIIYRYLQPKNLNKFSPVRLYFFIKRRIKPIYSVEVTDLTLIQNEKDSRDVARIKQNQIIMLMLNVFLNETIKWIKSAIIRRWKRIVK